MQCFISTIKGINILNYNGELRKDKNHKVINLSLYSDTLNKKGKIGLTYVVPNSDNKSE